MGPRRARALLRRSCLAAYLLAPACSLSGPVEERALSSLAPLDVGRSDSTRGKTGVSSGETPLDGVEAWPVPAASGPFLAPLELASPVYATPDKQAEKIGYLLSVIIHNGNHLPDNQ